MRGPCWAAAAGAFSSAAEKAPDSSTRDQMNAQARQSRHRQADAHLAEAEELLAKETLSLPDIVRIMGPRPFPMKETLKEYLVELTERQK